MKRLLLSSLAAFSMWQSLAFADDIDIYLRTRENSPKPYLMLTFDYRNDMASTYCTGLDACRAAVGLEAGEPDENSPLLMALKDIVGDPDLAKANNLQALLSVLQVVFAKFDDIYVGLMMPNKVKGGTILRGFELFEDGDVNGAKQEIVDLLRLVPSNITGSDNFHAVSPKELHYEFWEYLNGGAVRLGDETLDNFPALPPPPDTGTDPYAKLRVSSTAPYYDAVVVNKHGDSSTANDSYISPFPVDVSSCTRLFEVHATSGNDASGNGDGNLNALIEANMSAAAAAKGYKGMVAYMANNDMVSAIPGEQALKSWYIQMGSAATDADDWAELMGTADQDNFMEVSGNKASLLDLQETLEAVFIEALSVSSTFVSASVPVNVFNRIQTLDNFYIALFEAKSNKSWPGNLKKLRLADTDEPPNGQYDDIIDARGLAAFSNEDGRLHYEALTYWTDPQSLPAADPDNSEIELRDGRAVARGGAGQQIPGFIAGDVGTANGTGTRQVYVEPATAPINGNSVSFDNFDANDTTLSKLMLDADLSALTTTDLDTLESLLGTRDTEEAKDIIGWGRGLDVDNKNNQGVAPNRDWVLGDAIHSRPLALNYGATGNYTQENPNIRLFMGTNDGFFHVFENTHSSGDESGAELFTFIPRESLPILKELRQNAIGKHPYGVDGEPVALVADSDLDGTVETADGDEVYVYVGMRRGGKSYYALDVSDPSATPKLQWKITKTTSGDFDELGYTFSTPRVVKVQYGGAIVDALIFAGGYDMNKDEPTVANLASPTDSEGNAIYVVNARTGELIWKAVNGTSVASNTSFYHSDLDHSIPSTVATLDSNSNGIADRAYVGDTGGNVWRIDLPEGKSADDIDHRKDNWKINNLANLGEGTEAGDRRFFHPPDLVETRDSEGNYDGILIESGDRANPLETTDENYLYLIKDRNTISGIPPASPVLQSNLTDTTSCVKGTDSIGDVACSDLDYGNGWKIKLEVSGEKGLASPLAADGQVYFTSYRPNESLNDNCEPVEGMGAVYLVNLKDGTAVNDQRAQEIGPGIPPQVTALGSDALIVPGAGMLKDPNGDSKQRDKLVDTDGKGMYIIYWREPGVDKLER